MEVGELWNENSSDTGFEDTSVPIFKPIKPIYQLGYRVWARLIKYKLISTK